MTNPGEHASAQNDSKSAEDLEREEGERLRWWMENHPEPEFPKDDLTESGPKIAEFERLVDMFESMHSLEALHAIVQLEPLVEAPHHPIRQPAKIALEPIHKLLRELEKNTDVSDEKIIELKAKYNRLSQAVGVISTTQNNTVDHQRKLGNTRSWTS